MPDMIISPPTTVKGPVLWSFIFLSIMSFELGMVVRICSRVVYAKRRQRGQSEQKQEINEQEIVGLMKATDNKLLKKLHLEYNE